MKIYAEWTFIISMFLMSITAFVLWFTAESARTPLLIAINLLAIINIISLIIANKEKNNG